MKTFTIGGMILGIITFVACGLNLVNGPGLGFVAAIYLFSMSFYVFFDLNDIEL